MKTPRDPHDHCKIEIADSAAKLAESAAELITGIISETLNAKNRVSLVLSGGSTPKALYILLAGEKYRDKIPWNKVLIFFGDERCVPPDDTKSNYKMAYDTLLSKVPIPEENIFRMKGEIEPIEAAKEYEEKIKTSLGDDPNFDIVLLGMGADGHTASLFPATAALSETAKLVAANYVEKLNTYRLTLTLPAINASHNIIFMVAGKDKAETVKTVLEKTSNAPLPAQLIDPVVGSIFLFLDQEAVTLLNDRNLYSRKK